MKKYVLATNYGLEGWILEYYDNLEQVKKRIQEGVSNEFKIFKELEFEIKETE